MRSVIALAPNPWHGPWRNRQQILSRLGARGWNVAYSSGPLNLWYRNSPEWANAPLRTAAIRVDNVLVERPGLLFPLWSGSPRWEAFVARRHARELARLAGSDGPRVLYIFNPYFARYIDWIPADLVVYHAYDAFPLYQDRPAAQARNERLLIDRADHVIASSQGIARALEAFGCPSVRVLPNGGDYDAFRSGEAAPCPPDLASIPRPRIGYVGLVNPKIDIGLVYDIAVKQPAWHWVFIGKVREDRIEAKALASDLDRCKQLPNVHFLGEKPISALPAYMHGMDVNVMCYSIDRSGYWNAGYPLKMHEYLAVGKPIVAADLEAIRPFRDVIDIRHDPPGWIEAIGRALERGGVGSVEDRRRVARENSWDARVAQLESWLLQDLEGGLAARKQPLREAAR